MNVIVDHATDVCERTVNKHGIISGLAQYRNRHVKIIVLENVLAPLPEPPHSSGAMGDAEQLPLDAHKEEDFPLPMSDHRPTGRVPTADLIRGYISSP